MLQALLLTAALLFRQSDAAPATGAVGGHIAYADGTPFLNFPLVARVVSESGKPSEEPVTYSRTTEVPGEFRFRSLPPGRYQICSFATPLCFPDAATSGGPAFLTVVAGSAIENLNFVLPAAMTGFHVRGSVIRSTGQTNFPMSVQAASDPENFTARISLDGTFEFLHLLPGTYAFTVFPPNGMHPLSVAVDRDIDNLEIAMPRLIEISGTVTVEGRTNLSGVFDVRRENAFSLRFDGPIPFGSLVQSDGTFKATLVEGEYRVLADRVPAGYYLKSLSSSDTDLFVHRFAIAPSDQPIPITVALGISSGVSVSGNVTGLSNSKSPARIVLSGTVVNNSVESEIQTDGSFVFPKVVPGPYVARVTTPSSIASPPVAVLVPNKNVSALEIALPPPVKVSGRVVVDGNGPPPKFDLLLARGSSSNWNSLQDSTAVANLQREGSAGTTQIIQIAVDALPDGSFKVELPAGSYQVAASRPSIRVPYFLRSMTYTGTDLLKEPLRISDADSSEILVEFGTTARSPWSRVTGKVIGFDPNQGPFRVALDGEFTSAIEAAVHPDGTFEFERVLQKARYTAILRPENKMASSPRVSVAEKDVTNVEILVPHEQEINGRVVVDGRAEVPSFILVLSHDSNVVTVLVKPDPSGLFRIRMPDDERQVRIDALPFGYDVKSLVYGATDLLACARGTPPRCSHPPLKIGNGAGMNLQITFTLNPDIPFGKLSGKVKGLDTDASGARLILSNATNFTTFEERLDSDGAFAFTALPQGAYVPTLVGLPADAAPGKSAVLSPSLITVNGLEASGMEFAVSRVSARRERAAIVETSVGAHVTDLAGGNRGSAQESAAVATLRTLVTAEVTLLAANKGTFGSLDQMITEGLLPANLRGPVNGFHFGVISVGGDFVIAGIPETPANGQFAFYVTPDGAVRYSTIEALAPAGKAGNPLSQ